MFERVIDIINLLKNKDYVKTEEIRLSLKLSKKMTNYYCGILTQSGILRSKKGCRGGYRLSDIIKIGNIFSAIDMPIIETKNKTIDKAFMDFLQMQLF